MIALAPRPGKPDAAQFARVLLTESEIQSDSGADRKTEACRDYRFSEVSAKVQDVTASLAPGIDQTENGQ
jgi:hypothetical protein